MTIVQALRPVPPTFDDPYEQREHLKGRLAAGFRIFHELGFDEGVMGHLSARDPVDPNLFWLNPFAVSFGILKASDMQLVTLDGALVEGRGAVHPGAMILHPDIYAAHPEIQAIGHSHSLFGRIWSTFGRLLDPITNESAVFFGRHSLYDSHANGEGANLAAALRADDAGLIMVNHGIVTVGQTVDEMLYRFLSLEKCCQVQIQSESVGTPRILPDDIATRIAQGATPERGWLNFQPSFESIVREQPDLLD